jgi:hypothetical protein
MNGYDVSNKQIDHIDGDRKNNKLSNLRIVRSQQNRMNSRISNRNTSGHIGVLWNKRYEKWQVQICKNYTQGFYGNFTDYETASKKADEIHHALGFHKNHGRQK